MSSATTDEQDMLGDMLASYLRDHIGSTSREELWAAFADRLGIAGALLPGAVGGVDGGIADAAVIMREMGRALVVEPVLESFVMSAALASHASSPAISSLLQRVVGGKAKVAWAYAEREARFEHHHVAAVARREGAGWHLAGAKTVVYGAPDATDLIVFAQTDDVANQPKGISAFLVDARATGVAMRRYRAIDGRAVADINLQIELPGDALVGAAGEGGTILDDAVALGLVGTCAEMAGVLRRMIELTVEHVRDRKQFGKPLASFQALRHHLVDCWVVAEQADAMVGYATDALARPPADRDLALAAAKVFLGHARQVIGRYAIQFHGAMGTTDETPVSAYFRRATVLETRFGSTDHHLGRFLEGGGALPAGADLPDDEMAFRDEVRAFLDEKLSGLRDRIDGQAGFICERDLHRDWQAMLYERGWDVPSWPAEHGGAGWSPARRYIFQSELAAAGAPFGAGMGINLCAPVIMGFGTDEQKAFFLPRIRTGEHYWAQGFSEPGSGSDLASLQLRAVRDGDDYVVNGSKIWTTHAHYANWIFLLLRTSVEERKQDGISFLLSPLDLPGITVRPITSMSGEREVNQVFFDDVRIPVANLVGAEGQGWEIARYLLNFERGGRPFGAGLRRRIETLKAMAAREPDGRGGRLIDDAVFRHRLAEVEIRLIAADRTEQNKRLAQPVGGSLSAADASLLKLLASELTQDVQELTMDVLGPYAAADQRAALEPNVTDDVIGPDHALTPTARYLNGRAYTIFGGASEVQRDILARIALHLD